MRWGSGVDHTPLGGNLPPIQGEWDMGNEYDQTAASDDRVGSMRVANTCHFILGAIFVVAGVIALIASRDTLQGQGVSTDMARELSVAITMLLFGGLQIGLSMTYWGFSFSQSDVSLPGSDPAKPDAARKYLLDILKDGIQPAQRYPGAIGGLLNSVTPKLNLAPLSVRALAYIQALRSINLSVLLGGFLLSWLLASPEALPYMAAFYFLFAISEVRPQQILALIRAGRADVAPDGAFPKLGLGKTVVVLVVSVLGPVAVTALLSKSILPPPPAWLGGLMVPTLAILVPALIGSVLFFLALSRQTSDLAPSKVRWTGDDSFLVPDLTDGTLSHLARQVPDQKVAHQWHFAADKSNQGSLLGTFLYETEPQLVAGQDVRSMREALSSAWSSPLTRPLLALEAMGLLLGLTGCVALYRLASLASPDAAAMALGLLAASQYCMLAAHGLWKRADFRSTLYQVELDAQFERVVRNQGNARLGGGTYEDNTAKITSGRMLVRVAEMRSVQFWPKGLRHATSLDLDNSLCNGLIAAAQQHRNLVRKRQDEFNVEQKLQQQMMAPGTTAGAPPALAQDTRQQENLPDGS